MQLPRDNNLFFKSYFSPIYQKEQPLWAWTKAYTPDGKTFYPFCTLGTCKDYIIDSFIGYRIAHNDDVLYTKEVQQQNCVLILCNSTKKKQFLDNLNLFNEFCTKQGTKPTTITEIEIKENPFINAYAVMGDSIWSKNAFVYSIYLSMIRMIHKKPLDDTYFHEGFLRNSDEGCYLNRFASSSKYVDLAVNTFQNPSQHFEDLPSKYDVRGATQNLSHAHGIYGPFNILISLHYLNVTKDVYDKPAYLNTIKDGYFYEKFQNELCPPVTKPAPKKRPVPKVSAVRA